jgi:hypothetical protein
MGKLKDRVKEELPDGGSILIVGCGTQGLAAAVSELILEGYTVIVSDQDSDAATAITRVVQELPNSRWRYRTEGFTGLEMVVADIGLASEEADMAKLEGCGRGYHLLKFVSPIVSKAAGNRQPPASSKGKADNPS